MKKLQGSTLRKPSESELKLSVLNRRLRLIDRLKKRDTGRSKKG